MSTDRNSLNHSFDEIQALNNKFDEQLKTLQSGAEPEEQPLSISFRKLIVKALLLAAILIAPFVLLIRISVAMYLTYELNGWLALSIGVAATVLLLIGYALFVAFRYNQSIRIHKYIWRGVMGLVLAYTFYGLIYYSGLNTKTEAIKSYYTSLHPIMRVALTTVTLADSDLVVTDIYRQPEDYTRMGLPVNEYSLHYTQPNGYVHAVDLRTKGRAEWKNRFTRIAFEMIGLQTIRHVGTADHLHVYLPVN